MARNTENPRLFKDGCWILEQQEGHHDLVYGNERRVVFNGKRWECLAFQAVAQHSRHGAALRAFTSKFDDFRGFVGLPPISASPTAN